MHTSLNQTPSSSAHCPVCGAISKFAFRSPYVDVGKCTDLGCGHLHALAAAPDDGVQTHKDSEAKAALYKRRNAALVLFWRQRSFLSPNAWVLDVGAGAGHIASEIARTVPGVSMVCIEADPPSCGNLLAKGFKCYDSIEQCVESFDAILLVEVIEHIAKPVEFLRACRQRMRPGAKIFLSTPCGETSKQDRNTNAYTTKEHVQFFTEASMKRACSLAGLRVGGFETVTEMYPRRGGIAGLVDELKYRALPMRDLIKGRFHLITFLEFGD